MVKNGKVHRLKHSLDVFSLICILFVALRHHSGIWPSFIGLRDYTNLTPHTPWDSSETVINPTQRLLPDNADTHKRQNSMPRRRDTNTQSQKASRCTHTS